MWEKIGGKKMIFRFLFFLAVVVVFGRGRRRGFKGDCSSNSFASPWPGCSSFRGRLQQRPRWRSSCYERKLRWRGNSRLGLRLAPPWWPLHADAPSPPCSPQGGEALFRFLWPGWSAKGEASWHLHPWMKQNLLSYLFPHGLDILKGLVVGDGVYNDKALTIPDVQVPHGGKLLGACSVEDLQHWGRPIHLDLLAVKVLNGGVILLHEASGHKLYSQGRLANSTGAKDYHFELPHLGWEVWGQRKKRKEGK